MSTAPVIQYFTENATWVKPEGAVRVDVMACPGGGGGGFLTDGQDGEVQVKTFPADAIPDEIQIEIGRGGRGVMMGGDGADGYVLVLTHLADPKENGR